MKVLHVTNAYPYEDYDSYGIFIKEQIESLNFLGIDNHVAFINARKYGNKEYIKSYQSINKIVRFFKPDIIHCHHQFSLMPISLYKNKPPIVLSILGDITNRSFLDTIFFDMLKNIPEAIILKNMRMDSSKYYYLPNGVNINLFREIDRLEARKKLNLDKDKCYALFVTARLNNPVKRYDKYKHVIDMLKSKYLRDVEPLIMCGIKRELVPYYYNASNFLLITSDHEGSPNTVKEAMACNLPIVSTDVGNVEELFGSTMGLFLSKHADIVNLAANCVKAIDIRKSNGRKRLLEDNLTMNMIAEKLKIIYENILN